MKWNIDFEITSLFFQLIFIFFFFVKKHLPIRQNRLYIMSTVASFTTVFLDVTTAVLNSYASMVPMPVLHITNVLYFISVPALSLLFFLYILALTKQYQFVHSPVFYIFIIPAVASFVMAAVSPFIGMLYYFDDAMNYVQGPGYILEFGTNAFYIVLAVAFVIVYRDRATKLERNSIFMFCMLLALGAIIQGLFLRWVLLTNAMTALALIVIYLALQNPDIYIDKSSGLFNKDAFTELTQEMLIDGNPFSCVYVVIEDYRNLDVMYGAENVNHALMEVSDYFKRIFSRKRVYRFAPNSFMIQENNTGDLKQTVDAIRARFDKSFKGITEEIIFGANIVVLPYWHMPNDITNIDIFLDFGEKLACTKSMGGGYTVEIDDDIIDMFQHDRAVDRAIENAIANNSIQIYYQPIFSTETGNITSCEALARLFDYEIGFISPEEFIRKAEDNGSIIKLGLQIFEKVCEFIRDSSPEQYGLTKVHVNLSPVQCNQESLAGDLIELTQRYDIPRRLIEFEITETAAVEKNRIIKKNMDKLIEASFSFSLDDYGTGFSNTATIIQLPFTIVKIDKSLLWSYYDGRSNILPDLVRMFHNQNLKLVVEGVETKEMVDGLTEMGCQFLQGYYYSKPLPQREFMMYMREFNKR